VALGLLYELFGEEVFGMEELKCVQAFTPAELSTLKMMLKRGLNSPVTSSAGRLFDGVASLAGLRQVVRFEGQAAMEMEFAVEDMDSAYPFEVRSRRDPTTVDWEPMVREILSDVALERPVGEIAAKFHNTLVEMIVSFAQGAGFERVVLSGGCFQNKYLTERAVRRLREAGFRPYWHQRVPPNDGGICLGQIVAAARSCK
jgi:hydrogenase maturation protein HypF